MNIRTYSRCEIYVHGVDGEREIAVDRWEDGITRAITIRLGGAGDVTFFNEAIPAAMGMARAILALEEIDKGRSHDSLRSTCACHRTWPSGCARQPPPAEHR